MKTTLATVMMACLLSACTFTKNTETTMELPKGSLLQDGKDFFTGGDIVLRGYSEIIHVDEPFCQEDCEQYRALQFHFTESGHDISDFIEKNRGNSFVDDQQFRLGCVKDGILSYWNDADETGMTEYTVEAELSKAIIDATKNQPITLRLNKLPYTGGRGAPACYSHFSQIERVKS